MRHKHFCLRNIFSSDGTSTLGVSLSLNSHTCIHRGDNASGYHSHLFLEKELTVSDHLPDNMSELSFPLLLLSNT